MEARKRESTKDWYSMLERTRQSECPATTYLNPNSADRACRDASTSVLTFIDDQISAARANIVGAQQKLSVLEELRRDCLAKPGQFDDADVTRPPARQLLATKSIATYLKHQTEPVPTTVLLCLLEEQGIKFRSRHPRNTLSVLLSRSKQFIAHNRRGWTFVGEDQA